MLPIRTFDQRAGGHVAYKAMSHPLAADAIRAVFAELAEAGPVVVFDPDGLAEPLLALNEPAPPIAALFVQDIEAVGTTRAGLIARPLTELAAFGAGAVLVAAFDSARAVARIAALVPKARVIGLDRARLPDAMLINRARYLDRLNFATNFAFFREADGMSTRLVTANYWAGYGAARVSLWLRLFAEDGSVLATWTEQAPLETGGIVIDSRAVRSRFGLPPFTGQLFIHAIGVCGHDVVKYALDTYASENGASLSCTHDANAWPAERYAGLPAPRDGEQVVLWVQNSHPCPIPAGGIALGRMGHDATVALPQSVPGFATLALDVRTLLPALRWPDQIEVHAGRHVVRPRYEVTRENRTRIAHVNVERSDLRADPAIPALPAAFGRGFILPFPVLDPARFRTTVLPTPMAHAQAELPLRLDVFGTDGSKRGERFLGRLPRDHAVAVDVDALPDIAEGHAELAYDFREGGEADGWFHALVRHEAREGGHAAETSFGAHIFNTLMTFRDEPQSYSGPPPGLSTRLFLRLGEGRRRAFAVLIYPTSAAWLPHSSTRLMLYAADGALLAEEPIAIAQSGSVTVWPDEVFGPALLARAAGGGYVAVRDATCRLFGYHGLMDDTGGFSLDHMFGF
jgi:hypothetical protein